MEREWELGCCPGPACPCIAFIQISWRGQELSHLLRVVATAMCPEEHGSPGKASRTVGQRHPGKRASGFFNFCVGCGGLFTLIQLVLSIVRPLFPAGRVFLPCPAAGCVVHTRHCSLASGSLTPAAAALPGQGPLLRGQPCCPWGCAGTLCPFTQHVFPRAALFIGGDAERKKMSISGGIGLVVACSDILLYFGAYFCLIYCHSVFILQVFILDRALFTFLFLRGVNIC